MGQPRSVLLADPSVFLRERIAGILSRQDNVWRVLQVRGRDELMREACAHKPDLILADISLLLEHAFVRLLRGSSPGSRLVAMVEIQSEPYVKAALWLGADGILEKARVCEEIQNCLSPLKDERENPDLESA